MRITDNRYSRDRQRIDTAIRFIQHEARTHTIRQWTGLTDDRIRKLYRNCRAEPGQQQLRRHRGKSPQQSAWFVRTGRLRAESAVFASVCRLLALLPPPGQSPGAVRGDALRGSQLCQAYDVHRALCGTPQISFEYAVLLYKSLLRGFELRLTNCSRCRALMVADQLTLRAPRCVACPSDG